MVRNRLPRALGLVSLSAALAIMSVGAIAQTPATSAADVTFSKHISRILQRSCQECHHAQGVAPMALVTYEDVRPGPSL